MLDWPLIFTIPHSLHMYASFWMACSSFNYGWSLFFFFFTFLKKKVVMCYFPPICHWTVSTVRTLIAHIGWKEHEIFSWCQIIYLLSFMLHIGLSISPFPQFSGHGAYIYHDCWWHRVCIFRWTPSTPRFRCWKQGEHRGIALGVLRLLGIPPRLQARRHLRSHREHNQVIRTNGLFWTTKFQHRFHQISRQSGRILLVHFTLYDLLWTVSRRRTGLLASETTATCCASRTRLRPSMI